MRAVYILCACQAHCGGSNIEYSPPPQRTWSWGWRGLGTQHGCILSSSHLSEASSKNSVERKRVRSDEPQCSLPSEKWGALDLRPVNVLLALRLRMGQGHFWCWAGSWALSCEWDMQEKDSRPGPHHSTGLIQDFWIPRKNQGKPNI